MRVETESALTKICVNKETYCLINCRDGSLSYVLSALCCRCDCYHVITIIIKLMNHDGGEVNDLNFQKTSFCG